MYLGMKVAAVLPAYNEASYIESATAGLPREIFDDIIVVDDASTDSTADLAKQGGATAVIVHQENQGVGGALVTGFKAAVERANDVAVVVPGDGQADLTALPRLLDKVAEGYGLVMTDRLTGRDPTEWGMPRYRILGSTALSLMTWVATGIRIADPQSGYKAVTREALQQIPLDDLVKRWGIHNDMLSYCATLGIPVATVAIGKTGAKNAACRFTAMSPVLGSQATSSCGTSSRGIWLCSFACCAGGSEACLGGAPGD